MASIKKIYFCLGLAWVLAFAACERPRDPNDLRIQSADQAIIHYYNRGLPAKAPLELVIDPSPELDSLKMLLRGEWERGLMSDVDGKIEFKQNNSTIFLADFVLFGIHGYICWWEKEEQTFRNYRLNAASIALLNRLNRR